MFGKKIVYDYYFRWIRVDGWDRLWGAGTFVPAVMRETDGFVLVLVYGDTVGNEDCRLEDCVIFKGLTYL
jgi:hypothetical protein